MSLQIDMITQIDTVGRQKLINRLRFCSRMVSTRDKVYFEKLADYFDNLYKTAVPTEEDTPKFRKYSKTTIEVLSKYNRALNCKILDFTKRLIEYKLNAVKQLKAAS